MKRMDDATPLFLVQMGLLPINPRAMGPNDHGLKLPKLWAKTDLSFLLSWLPLPYCVIHCIPDWHPGLRLMAPRCPVPHCEHEGLHALPAGISCSYQSQLLIQTTRNLSVAGSSFPDLMCLICRENYACCFSRAWRPTLQLHGYKKEMKSDPSTKIRVVLYLSLS